MIQTLKDVDTLGYEIIVLARGGGSFEDLFCFNDERLVRTIYNLNTFIITGVGHQQDFTLVDFVSDRRAPTPTGAIEMITPNIDDVLDSIDDLSYRLNKSIDLLITNNKDKLIQLSNNKYFKDPSLLVDKVSLLLDYKIERLKRFSNKLDNYKLQIDKEVDRMSLLVDIKLNKKTNELDRLNGLLKAYSCENTLKRGYALVYKDNKLINKDIDNNDKLVIETYDQIIDTRVEKVSKKNG